ncbi:hypothetical protein E2C01_015372 [Portunus trituberculatus]|uniref:Uncharacterized protein n=1 Tax=Portunus trituberculatus TaxID=210409 RepID=A0A5B7DLN4_PORTR|nr:hypothetical protein [Portunus trituberculatus]
MDHVERNIFTITEDSAMFILLHLTGKQDAALFERCVRGSPSGFVKHDIINKTRRNPRTTPASPRWLSGTTHTRGMYRNTKKFVTQAPTTRSSTHSVG